MVTRTRSCLECTCEFSYPVGKGNDRKYCSKQCRVAVQLRLRGARELAAPSCPTEGCNGKVTRIGRGVCEACYCRERRTGNIAIPIRVYRYKSKAGYIRVLAESHPLADNDGCVYEHRKVIFDIVGEKVPPCYWCGTRLTWADTVIDHLNEVKHDNRPLNLVVSCNNCNRARGAMIPFVSRLRPEAFERLIETMRMMHDLGRSTNSRLAGKDSSGDAPALSGVCSESEQPAPTGGGSNP